MSDLVFARNCSIARMLPGETKLVSERTVAGNMSRRSATMTSDPSHT